MSRWLKDDIDLFLKWASEQGASDINLLPKSGIWIRVDGIWKKVTQRLITTDEIMNLIDELSYNASGSASIRGGYDYDFAYELKIDNIKRLRFRVNASGCKDGWSFGTSMVIRTIPSLPPKLEDLNVEKEIYDAAFPQNGLVLVTGVMGTGKSTLLASMLRFIRENQPRHILTYEAPIEFDLMGIPNGLGPLVQTEIPLHLKDFTDAPRNAARRAADVILVGESRDQETLKGMIEAAEIGVCAYSTVHTRGVAETPSRIINVFPKDMQNQITSTLISSLRLIIQQRLLPSTQGGRIALREYLVFDANLRHELLSENVEHLIPIIQDMLEKKGQTLLEDARLKFEEGLISEESFRQIKKEQERV